ncbi:ABC transporter substrate-binding protein [Desertimonas flava]|jgi:peptide/nickel transport system substrate-binding protein|uniref:ABC transporter substrate-binding protein n=1 Tax=Desertimonas flava TaxID=2064846 RepID=UPI000E34887C|nr:ABC transporter substrate-binding protein [Desertimonas flava]
MKPVPFRATLAAAIGLVAVLPIASGALDASAPPTSDAPASGGVLVAAQSAEPERFDPHMTSGYASYQVLENVFDTLVQPGDDLTMEPALATEWTVSDDQLTWTFTLREGVQFHNGRELTSADVVYSFERIRDPEVASGVAYRLDAVDTITALDDYTVEIVVTAPTPNLLTLLGGYKGMAIVAEENVTDGSIDTAPIGTGPFVFESYTAGDGVELVRNDNYWRADEGLPYLDGVRFVAIPDPTVKLTSLQTGDVDWIDGVPPAELESLEGSDDVVVGRVAGSDYHYFALNQTRPPFDDVRVRQAIATAIDREEITEAATFGAATANQTAIPDGSFWYYDYAPYAAGDIEAAQALLDEAGITDGFSIEFLVTSDYPETVTQAQVIAAQLEPLDIEVTINDVDFSTWLDLEAQGEFDAFMLSWIGNIDPDEFYYSQHHTDGTFNFQGYSNPALDELLDAARVEPDSDARKALYDEIATIIVDDASYIYLYNPDNIDAWSPDVSGYETRGDNAIRFVETSLG